MAIPTTRDEFKQYCLRALGAPVIEINVDDDQVDDRVDEALSYYADYHFDGTMPVYYKYLVTPTDKANKYLTMPDNIIGAIKVFSISDPAVSVTDMFNIRYQIALNDLYNLTSVDMVPYYMTMQHLGLIQELLVGLQTIRFNRHTNRLYIDTDWNNILEGKYLLVEAYQVVDPTDFPDIWKDRLLFKYASALIKRNWGANLKKYSGMQMPGGLTFNGQQLYDEADKEIKEIETEMPYTWSLPDAMMVN